MNERELFNGFDEDTLFLLAENKFNDSKIYYDEHKELLKQKATVPMRNLCSDLADELFAIDEHMNLIPTKMVSRIRRDTRFSKNKEMYRDNMWCMFMRHKKQWNYQPCMWFEFTPCGYSMGVGTFYVDPSYLEMYRKVILENYSEFKKAVKSALAVGSVPDLEQYGKPKEGDEKIERAYKSYYNAKYLYFINYSENISALFDGSVKEELRQCIKAYTPMYKFLLRVTEKMIEKKGQNYEQA